MKDRALLRIEGPLGSFYLREESQRPIIMMAGGTGIAPLKGILEHAFYIGFDRPIHLFWGVREKRDLYMDALPKAWSEAYPQFRYTAVLSDPEEGDAWQGETGFVNDAVVRSITCIQMPLNLPATSSKKSGRTTDRNHFILFAATNHQRRSR